MGNGEKTGKRVESALSWKIRMSQFATFSKSIEIRLRLGGWALANVTANTSRKFACYAEIILPEIIQSWVRIDVVDELSWMKF